MNIVVMLELNKKLQQRLWVFAVPRSPRLDLSWINEKIIILSKYEIRRDSRQALVEQNMPCVE
jgi:hypothetical protein